MQLRSHIGVARPHSHARHVGQACPPVSRIARPAAIVLIIAIVLCNGFFTFSSVYADDTPRTPRLNGWQVRRGEQARLHNGQPRLHNGQLCLKPDGTPCEQRMYFFLHDHLGGITATVDEDGNVVERNDYYPYGTERMNVKSPNAPTNSYLFTQGEYDEDLGLYYFNKRWYDPKLGRFMSPDPLLLNPLISDAELQRLLHNPQSLNMYSYAGNNPIRFIDPTGESPFTDQWKKYGDMMQNIAYSFIGLVGGSNALKAGGTIKQVVSYFYVGIVGFLRANQIIFEMDKVNLEISQQAIDSIKRINNFFASLAETEGVLGILARTVKDAPGWGEALEAIAAMEENKITTEEFLNSIKEVLPEIKRDVQKAIKDTMTLIQQQKQEEAKQSDQKTNQKRQKKEKGK